MMSQELIEKYRDINIHDTWFEFVYENWKDKLEQSGFMNPKIYFSGFWSQGDGACFDAECDTNRLARAVYKDGFKRELIDLLADYISISIDTISHHYSHSNTRRVSVTDYSIGVEIVNILECDLERLPAMISELEEDELLSGLIQLRLKYMCPSINIGDFFNSFEEDIEALRKRFSDEIYKDLENEYDSLTSDEAVLEAINANELEVV